MKRYIFFILTLALFTSCYQEINLDEYRITPKIVINCAAFTDAPITASVTRTWFYPENTPYVKLPHAKVELYVNGNFVEQMKWQPLETKTETRSNVPDSVFASGYVPKGGDRIKMVASNPGYQTVYAEDVVPAKAPITNIEYSTRKVDLGPQASYYSVYSVNDNQQIMNTEYLEVMYKVTFKDEPGQDNYYMIQVNLPAEDYGYGGAYNIWAKIYFIDPILKDYDMPIDGALGFDGLFNEYGCLFTDRDIKGQEYTLKLKEYVSPDSNYKKRQIILYSISEAYYQYILSLQKVAGSTVDGGLGNIGFAEPIQVYSNVVDGTGILGTSQYDSRDIEIKAE